MLQGRRNGQDGAGSLATALGVFNLALGSAQVLSPGGVSRLVGVQGSSQAVRTIQRVFGVRELVQGTGILASSSPRGWVWSRVTGDVLSRPGEPDVERPRSTTATLSTTHGRHRWSGRVTGRGAASSRGA